MADDILSIENLRVHFDTLDGPVEALHSVDLSVGNGEIMGLVGESGCGKSVTSLVTIGLATCDVDEGSVKYQGTELLHRDPPHIQRNINISSSITALSVLAAVVTSIWILIEPVQGVTMVATLSLVGGLSWLFGFFQKSGSRKHTNFMRWIRGNEISMIFQEPMTALNPLYTIEKQVSEVMKEHDRLVVPEVSNLRRAGQALTTPVRLIFESLFTRTVPSLSILLTLTFVIIAHRTGFAGDLKIYSFGLILLIPLFEYILSRMLNSDSENDFNQISLQESAEIGVRTAYFLLSSMPLGVAASLIIFLMLWMPFSALMGMLVICTLLALPAIMLQDYLRLDPAHRRQVVEILEDVQIPNPTAVVKMYPHELSGGMRQRVMIAMMMACEPKLLIADEPTTALDVTIQAQILKLMRNLRDEKGTAILLITHDLGVIAELCDAVTVMYAGSVVETGSLEQVLSRPRMPYSIGLLHSIPRITTGLAERETLPIIPGQVPDPNQHFDGCRFHPRCPFANEKCISTPPPMVEIELGHFAACHHTDRTTVVSDVQDAFDVFAAEYEHAGVA
ncbi:MAG: ABC transporter ATP-binding protein [Candidatus Thalassarchaeaceae archaeon]|nr:ABC transporter ATP-binding protein [Candidatus Thalassarchaeaceae archaeon]